LWYPNFVWLATLASLACVVYCSSYVVFVVVAIELLLL